MNKQFLTTELLRFFIVGFIFYSLLLNSSIAYGATEIGSTIPNPNMKLTNHDEKTMTLNTLKTDKGILIIFSCNTCPYAKAWEDRIVEIGNDAVKKGLGFALINPNDPKKKPGDSLKALKRKALIKNFKFPYLVDTGSKLAKAFGATKTPEVFLFDKSSKLIYHGSVDDNYDDPSAIENHYLKDALNQHLSNKKVTKNKTTSVGCSIKWYE